MISFLESVKTTGSFSKFPKPPKRKLQDFFKEKSGKKKARKEITTPAELHQYLIDNFADVSSAISREMFSEKLFSVTGPSDENEIINRLQKGFRNLKRQDAQTLMIYIQFGNFLNLCKAWQEKEKEEGRMNQTWAAWLKEKTGYSDDHARKLRATAKILFGYKKFFHVGLPIGFIIGKLKMIQEMLQVPEFNTFWKEPIQLPSTLRLQQSQT
ncbi:hypothetical protein PoB_001780500 [Plakobranchus ocellatus]|uniref:Uncharacterized protein n=1 Tax=Plakobranchus ocellatus TaxID=259542 RepID=A0AAV3Z9U6_9GAST|nr:hypothetical protein PoB_001780500 [Plakobranchus ocellatus]